MAIPSPKKKQVVQINQEVNAKLWTPSCRRNPVWLNSLAEAIESRRLPQGGRRDCSFRQLITNQSQVGLLQSGFDFGRVALPLVLILHFAKQKFPFQLFRRPKKTS